MMTYNTQRERLIIPEYGRNIQQMVQLAMEIEDRDERNKAAKMIIQVMGQVNPHLRDVGDFAHKLWDHLFIISDFTLDVDSPFEKPEAEALNKKPQPLKYPNQNIKYKHYGKTIESIIEAAIELEDGEMKQRFTEQIANLMKKSYLNWNRDTVNDIVIREHLEILSKGKLTLDPSFEFEATNDLLGKQNKKKKITKGKKSNQGHRKKKH